MRALALCGLLCGVFLIGCEKKPPCTPVPSVAEAWPLKDLVPRGEHTAICPAAEDAATHASFWRPVRVHRANVDIVGQVQDAGWTRNRDNWYDTKGNYDTPKWSEFSSDQGKLRVDVREDGDGSSIKMVLTPAG